MIVNSNIEIVSILPEHFSFFETYDPLDKLELAVLPGAFAIGAFDRGEDGKRTLPVALMVVTKGQNSLVCEWLAVALKYRGREIGGTMLRLLFEAAEKMGYETVTACFSEKTDEIARDYCLQRFFEKSNGCMGRYIMSASDFIAEGKFSEIRAGDPCFSLREAESRIINEASAFAKRARILHTLSDGEIAWNIADPDLSVIYTDGEKVRGVIVVAENDDIYTPVLLAGESQDEVNTLIAESLKRLKNKPRSGKEICIYVRSRYIEELIGGIIGLEDLEREEVLTARVSDYTAYRDSIGEDETGETKPESDTDDIRLIDGVLDLEFYLSDYE